MLDSVRRSAVAFFGYGNSAQSTFNDAGIQPENDDYVRDGCCFCDPTLLCKIDAESGAHFRWVHAATCACLDPCRPENAELA
jgi:hypothetical protein